VIVKGCRGWMIWIRRKFRPDVADRVLGGLEWEGGGGKQVVVTVRVLGRSTRVRTLRTIYTGSVHIGSSFGIGSIMSDSWLANVMIFESSLRFSHLQSHERASKNERNQKPRLYLMKTRGRMLLVFPNMRMKLYGVWLSRDHTLGRRSSRNDRANLPTCQP
jgi:hypothetical protein